MYKHSFWEGGSTIDNKDQFCPFTFSSVIALRVLLLRTKQRQKQKLQKELWHHGARFFFFSFLKFTKFEHKHFKKL
jgi:hypothetical protein